MLPIRVDLAVEGPPRGSRSTRPRRPRPVGERVLDPASTAEPSASAGTDTPPSDDAGPGVGPLVIAAGVGAAVVALLGLVVGLAIRRSVLVRSGLVEPDA